MINRKPPLRRRKYHHHHPNYGNYQSNLVIYHGSKMDSYGETSADFSSITTRTDDVMAPLTSSHDDSLRPVTPERVFKIIFIGDTSVGKTSIISRFCRNHFLSKSTNTIGVDFQTRSLLVDEIAICLQCWDTAGQERYRCVFSTAFFLSLCD